MATAGPAPIAYESPLPGLVNLLKYFGGENQKTTSGGTSVNVQQGQTGPLEMLLAQMSDPANLQNLVGNLFAQGAQQVPGLTAQFANATGSRVSGNSGLAQALALLQQTIAQSIAAATVDQQKTAMTGAAELGKTNKTNTETQNKTQNQKTAAPTSSRNAGIAAMLGLHALNKTGVWDKMGSKGNVPESQLPNIGADFKISDQDFAMDSGMNAPDAFMPATELAAPAAGFDAAALPSVFDAASELGGMDWGGAEINMGFDAATTAVETGEALGAIDSGSELLYTDTDFTEVLDFDFGSFFADGGMVGADSSPIRGRANMGRVSKTPMLALNAGAKAQAAMPQVPQMQVSNSRQQPRKREAVPAEVGETGGADANPSPATAPGVPGGINPAKSLAVGLLGLALGAPPATAVAMGLKNAAIQGIISAMFGAPPGQLAAPQAQLPPANVVMEGSFTSGPLGGDMTGATGPTGGGGAPTGDTGVDSTPSGAPAGGDSTSDATGSPSGGGGASTDGPSDGGSAGTGGTGDASAGDSTGGADGGNMADGGKVKGKATGIDKKLIHVTPGEYVLPVDTVQYLGLDVLDEIVAATHTPIRR